MVRQNKSSELTEILRHRIISGQLQAGEQLETISTLVKRHKTTIATVCKALTNLEQAGYVERFPGKGVFVKERKSCRLALAIDSGTFAHDSANMSLMPILLNELEQKCQEENWTYELFFSVNDKASAQNFLLKLAQNNFDVVLIGSRWLAENSKEIFNNKSVFTIGIFPYKDLEFSVNFDGYRMVYDAVLELDQQGCRQIALIAGDNDQSWAKNPDWSIEGYHDALKSIGKLRDPKLHLNVSISQKGGHNAFLKLIKRGISRPLGIICVDSVITLGVIQAVLHCGYKISEDVIIATHANQGCGVAQFTSPVIKFESSINDYVDRIAKLVKLYNSGLSIPPSGILIKSVKKVPSRNEMLCAEAFV